MYINKSKEQPYKSCKKAGIAEQKRNLGYRNRNRETEKAKKIHLVNDLPFKTDLISKNSLRYNYVAETPNQY